MNTNTTTPNSHIKPTTNDDINREMLRRLKNFNEQVNTIKPTDGNNGNLKKIKNGGRRRSTARPLPRRRSSKRKSRKSRSTRRR